MDESSLPEVEEKLRNYLGDRYSFADWKPFFDGIFNAEKDAEAALAIIDKLRNAGSTSPPSCTPASTPTSNPIPTDSRPNLTQLSTLETGLIKSVAELQARKRINGTAPTLEELVNPIEENEIGDSPYRFPGGDDEILDQVLIGESGNGHAVDAGDSEDEDDLEDDLVSCREAIQLCERLEKVCVTHSDAEGVAILELQRQLRKLRGHFRRVEAATQKQSTLDSFFTPKDVEMT